MSPCADVEKDEWYFVGSITVRRTISVLSVILCLCVRTLRTSVRLLKTAKLLRSFSKGGYASEINQVPKSNSFEVVKKNRGNLTFLSSKSGNILP